jgi:type II secretory pathway component PulF
MTNATATARPAANPRAKIAPAKTVAGRPGLPSKSKRVREFSKKELVTMFRAMASMLRAQITTADALKYYSQGNPNKLMVAALSAIRADISAGMSIHEAFRRTRRFNDMIIGLIQAGSDAGQLHSAFKSLAERLASELHFQKALRKATLMPSVIIAVLGGAFIVSQIKIVPQVEDMLDGVGAKPDGLTALAFQLSHFTQAVWPFVVLAIIAAVVTIALSSQVRNAILNVAMSRWRLLRLLIMCTRQMTFLSTIKLLHSNGINLAKAIRTSANSVKSTPFYAELREAADKYENSGVPLSTAFSKYTSVDAQVVHMLSIGEKSASLDTQLEMLSEMYAEDSESHMATFTAVLGFIVLIIAVCLIAAVFTGTFLPIFLMGPKMMSSAM